MCKAKFKLEDYVNLHYSYENDEELGIEDIDKLETERDTFRRNVRNLLQNFEKDFKIADIDFNRNVFNYFPLYEFEDEEIYKFIDRMQELKRKHELLGNKVIFNLKKINIDNVKVSINDLYIKEPEISLFQTNIYETKQKYRNLIKNNKWNIDIILENFNELIKKLENANNPADFGKLSSLTFDIALQIVNHWVICANNMDIAKQLEVIEEIKKYLTDFENDVENFSVSYDKDNIADYITIFIEFIRSFNYCSEYINISKILLDEVKNTPAIQSAVKPEYQIKKGMNYRDYNYKEIICEGDKIYKFKEKLEMTKKAIKLLNKNSIIGFDVYDLQDLKVYFREIYISKSKYKSKASTIIRKLNNNSIDEFEKNSEYIFLREKIKRGYFRERYPMELYQQKMQIKEQLYVIMLKIMLCYDYKVSLDFFQQLINKLCFTIVNTSSKEIDKEKVF